MSSEKKNEAIARKVSRDCRKAELIHTVKAIVIAAQRTRLGSTEEKSSKNLEELVCLCQKADQLIESL